MCHSRIVSCLLFISFLPSSRLALFLFTIVNGFSYANAANTYTKSCMIMLGCCSSSAKILANTQVCRWQTEFYVQLCTFSMNLFFAVNFWEKHGVEWTSHDTLWFSVHFLIDFKCSCAIPYLYGPNENLWWLYLPTCICAAHAFVGMYRLYTGIH